MRALGLLVLLLGAGCSSTKSPCASLGTYSCIDATVQGDVGKLDELRVTIDFPKSASLLSPPTPMTVHLPVELGIALPPAAAGHEVHVFVEGMLDGSPVAKSAVWDENAPVVGSPIPVTFTLEGASTDGGTTGGPITATPSTLGFTDTVVGRTSIAFITVANTTSGDLSIGAPVFAGDMVFAIGTAPVSDTMACPQGAQDKVAANASCHEYLSFTPTKTGASAGTVTVPLSSGSTAFTVTLQGNGLAPVFVDESIVGGPDFQAVSGTSATNIFVVGPSASDCVYVWDGTTWNNRCNDIEDPQLNSVYALDPTHTWIGGFATAKGISHSLTKGLAWTNDTIASSATGASDSQIVALLAISASDIYAVESTGTGAQGVLLNSHGDGSWTTFATPSSGALRAIATNGTYLMVAGDDGAVAFALVDKSFLASVVPTGIMSTVSIEGAWGAPGGLFYFVAQGTAGAWGIFSIDPVNGETTQVYALSDVTEGLSGISGRVVIASAGSSTSNIDLYAVGGLGANIVHCFGPEGSLSCGLEATQTKTAMNAVWVGPDGGVVAVGANGAIAHLH